MVKESACNAGDFGFNPWIRKNSWRKKWQATPTLLPGKSHGQRSLAATVLGLQEKTQFSDQTTKIKNNENMTSQLKISRKHDERKTVVYKTAFYSTCYKILTHTFIHTNTLQLP